MTNDNDLLLLASSQNIKTFEVYIDSSGKKTLTPQASNYTAKYQTPYVCYYSGSSVNGLLADKNPKKILFPNCSKATNSGNGTWSGAFCFNFRECTSLTSVSFPSLTSATGGSQGHDGAFYGAFRECTSLTSVSFPSLTSATGGSGDTNQSGAFYNAFYKCTSLTSVSFPSLTSATSSSDLWGGAFYEAFIYCTSLTSVSFPSLTSVTRYAFYDAFSQCSPSLKVHFKKSMKSNTNLSYSALGLKSADQVVFDLP